MMWLGSLLTSGAASFGRVLIVGLLPNTVPAVFVVLLWQAQSFSGPSNFRDLPKTFMPDALGIVLFVLAVVVITVVIQPFQLRVLRVLEGYWDAWMLTARLAPFFIEFQRRRRGKLIRVLNAKATEPDSDSIDELVRHSRERERIAARQRRAGQRLQRYPASRSVFSEGTAVTKEVPLLPTGLGNTLRVGETSAGERYGLHTLSSWPRLYPFFPESFAEGQASMRDAMDAAANLCMNFLIVTVLGVIALYDEPAFYWIIVLSAGLCCVSYLGAIATAAEYNVFIQTAYDLYRFELLKGARYPLPKNPAEELELFGKLSKLYSADFWDSSINGAHELASRTMRGTAYAGDEDDEDDDVIAAILRRIRRNP